MRRLLPIVATLLTLLSYGCPLYYDLDEAEFVDSTQQSDAQLTDTGSADANTPDAGTDMFVTDAQTGDVRDPDDAGTGSDAGDVGADAGRGDAGETDAAADMEPDAAVDMATDMGVTTFGQTCPNAVALAGMCSLVVQDCMTDQICELRVTSMGPMSGCVDIPSGTEYTLAEGSACSPQDMMQCAPGLVCRIGKCVRYCDLIDARGCEPDQFCRAFDAAALPGVGFCDTSCP